LQIYLATNCGWAGRGCAFLSAQNLIKSWKSTRYARMVEGA
jgi:hypothetical protein